VTQERRTDSGIEIQAVYTPEDVPNVEKKMPRDFISEDGFHITDKCRRYLSPLIQGEDYPPYANGLPQYVVLKNAAVPKKINTVFEVKK